MSTTDHEDAAIKEWVRILLEEGCNVSVEKKRVKELPEWFDEKLFTRGQKYFFANFYAMFVSKLTGLILVLTIPTILDVLVSTNKSSDAYHAFRRYSDTIKHMVEWYKHDLKNFNSKSQKSVTLVTGLHCAAIRLSEKSGLGLRVTQRDMVLTQFGFIGLILLRKKELGIIGTEQDDKSIVHFWRTMGYMLGIHDKYNLCQGSVDEVRSMCATLMKEVYVPALKNPPAKFNSMVTALIEGIKPISPMLDVDAVMTFLYDQCGVSKIMEPRLTTTYSRWMYNIQMFTHNVLLSKAWLACVFRPLLNYNMMFSVWLNINFPFGAAFRFGTKVFYPVQDNVHHQPIDESSVQAVSTPQPYNTPMT